MLKRLLFVFVVFFLEAVTVYADGLSWKQISRDLLDTRDAVCSYIDGNIIYLAASSGIFMSTDRGSNWRIVLAGRKINKIYADTSFPKSVYAATSEGIWQSPDAGQSWKRIFKGKDSLERYSTSFLSLPDIMLNGTQSGLFLSTDKGRTWRRVSGYLSDTCILAISSSGANSKYIYVASVDGVYMSSDKGQTWDKIYAVIAPENYDAGYEEDVQEDSEQSSIIRYVSVAADNDKIIYIATTEGVYHSDNLGLSWERISSYGLLSRDVYFVLPLSKDKIYAATKTGLFLFDKGRWQELTFGLPIDEIRSVYSDKKENLYLATDRGLFMSQGGKNEINVDKDYHDSIISDGEEPGINKVQEAAIEYAEVNIKKIKDWRKQAQLRAFLPKIAVDFDCDRDKTVSTNTWGIYSSYSNSNITAPARHYVGPDDSTRYYNNNWGVSLVWELGDLIWSEAQTSIDVRSRLMVQLRDDVLDEVTKLYFERIRVRMELDNLSIEDRKKRFEKELKLAELTAQIDALTGGYFSSQLEKKY